jgi:hypothetical protein
MIVQRRDLAGSNENAGRRATGEVALATDGSIIFAVWNIKDNANPGTWSKVGQTNESNMTWPSLKEVKSMQA